MLLAGLATQYGSSVVKPLTRGIQHFKIQKVALAGGPDISCGNLHFEGGAKPGGNNNKSQSYKDFEGTNKQPGKTAHNEVEIKEVTESSTPVGRSGQHLKVTPGTNTFEIINEIKYSGHVLDRMQERGIVPSVVENAVKNLNFIQGKKLNTIVYYDKINNLTIIQNSITGVIITVSKGVIKQ